MPILRSLLCPEAQQIRLTPASQALKPRTPLVSRGGIFLIGKRHPLSSTPPAPRCCGPVPSGVELSSYNRRCRLDRRRPFTHRRPSDTRASIDFAYIWYTHYIPPPLSLHHRKSPRQLTDEDRFVWIRCPVSPEGFQNKGSLKVPRCCVQESTDGKRRHLYLPFLFLPPACLNRQSLLNLQLLILSIPSSLLPYPFRSWLRTKQPSYFHPTLTSSRGGNIRHRACPLAKRGNTTKCPQPKATLALVDLALFHSYSLSSQTPNFAGANSGVGDTGNTTTGHDVHHAASLP